MVSLLCIADRTHSHLMDMMPEKCGLTGQTKHFEATLNEVIMRIPLSQEIQTKIKIKHEQNI